ncbi:MAG TPA: flagellar protein FlbB [Pseudolabrys sp.]|jgi:flagellar motility protein MotE (MotC chaperone)|nr:flagellar protein FlbB [Pseudolabrys sp.]
MIRLARVFRLLPVVILAAGSLFALKISGLLFDGGYTLGERLADRGKPALTITTAESVPAYPKILVAGQATNATEKKPLSWAEEMFNYGDGNRDITGALPEPPKDDGPPLKVSQKPPPPTKIEESGGAVAIAGAPGRIASPGEKAVLQRLQERRKQLDLRSRELDMRESLLKAAEKRVEARVMELKELESKISTAVDNRDKAEAKRFAALVSMYENMRAKDAARIFDHLDLAILVEVATRMKPRAMSEILAQMTPEAAERLTVELANRAGAAKAQSASELPKIDGQPSGS